MLGVGGLAGTASADPGGTTDGQVQIDASIALSGLPDGFLLTGIPGAEATTTLGDVTYNVATSATTHR